MAQDLVSERQAKAVLAELREHFGVTEATTPPVLYDNEHEDLPEGCWSIIWEDGAPEEWTYQFRTEVEGVHVEAANTVILNVYPDA